MFGLRHKNVQDRFFRAENKESADKWRKELAKVLKGTVPSVVTEGDTSGQEEPMVRTRSATTGQVHSTEHVETPRNHLTQVRNCPNKCYSEEVTSRSVDMTKMSEPTSSPTERSLEIGDSSGEQGDPEDPEDPEDLTETIKEQQSSVESKD